MRRAEINNKKSPVKALDSTIDQIIDHHYFIQKVSQIVEKKTESYLNHSESFADNKYSVHQEELVKQVGDIVCLTVDESLRKILNQEFIDVMKEVEDLKHQMYVFMEQQTKITSQMKTQLNKGLQQLKRKNVTDGIVGNIVPSRGSSVRLMRTNLKSNIQLAQKKSQYSEMVQIRKQLQQLQQQVQKGDNLTAVTQQFNQFKLEAKVSIESLKHEIKKLTGTVSKDEDKSKFLSPALKESISEAVKRGIKSQINVLNNYTQELSQIKQWVQKVEESVGQQQDKNQQYFSSQLKSVWLIINDVKRSVDSLLDHSGLHSELM